MPGKGWFLSPLLLVFSFLVSQLMNMCLTLMRACLCCLGSFKYFLDSKMHEIYEDFLCVNKNTA